MSAQSEAIPWSQLSLLPGDSHVRMSQSQGNAQVSKTAPGQDSGQSLTESFANYDPDTSLWRTSQACLLTGWEEFLETWPTSGTMRNGRCYRRQMSAHRTSGKGSSLWPTHRSCSAMAATITPESANKEGRFPSLETVVGQRMWPTPSATPRGPHTGAVAGAVSNDGMTRVSANGTRWGATLETAVQMCPTPSVKEKTGGQLNPTWVEWLMGFPSGWTDLRA